eukprot:TRINITY_DN90604_c0_g1_i1.p1 TRINITY_DN90604_c0_g1~~TRINITY_DN90604_c0_g1_i1.p1  ORF type:complete len:193 (-),score=38.77 TRINITY_DN90604_c0_g1_i1:6-584(-)
MPASRPYSEYGDTLTAGVVKADGNANVYKVFRQLDVPVLEYATLWHEVLSAGGCAVKHVKEFFGDSVLGPLGVDGGVDITKLRNAVCGKPEAEQAFQDIMEERIGEARDVAYQRANDEKKILVLFELRKEHLSICNYLVAIKHPGQEEGESNETHAPSQKTRKECLASPDLVLDSSSDVQTIEAAIRDFLEE